MPKWKKNETINNALKVIFRLQDLKVRDPASKVGTYKKSCDSKMGNVRSKWNQKQRRFKENDKIILFLFV